MYTYAVPMLCTCTAPTLYLYCAYTVLCCTYIIPALVTRPLSAGRQVSRWVTNGAPGFSAGALMEGVVMDMPSVCIAAGAISLLGPPAMAYASGDVAAQRLSNALTELQRELQVLM